MINPTGRNPVEILAEEFLERKRAGDSVGVEEYIRLHPDLAEEIQNLFPMMLAFEQFKLCRFSSSGRALDLQIGAIHQLGDFRIIREIGRGGMGVVYEAEQESLRRFVAVKVIPPDSISGRSQLERFHDEARLAAGLHHTNIVPVIGVGEQDGMHYYVMQRIKGYSLDECIYGAETAAELSEKRFEHAKTEELQSASTHLSQSDAGSLLSDSSVFRHETPGESTGCSPLTGQSAGVSEWEFIADIGIQVANALAHAHEHGVLHQDIKPGNLLLDGDGTVWVTDFGLATLLNSEVPMHPGKVAGTLRFMAPEHLKGQQDARSDVYSLGATLYEIATRRPAFEKTSRPQMMRRILSGQKPRPAEIRPEIPRDLEAIILKAMACEASSRYPNAAALADDLRHFVEGRPVSARPVGGPVRLWRWSRRNPLVATLLFVMSLGAGLSFAVISHEWRTAVDENKRAEGNLSLALESMDQILGRFTSNWMAHPITADLRENAAEQTRAPITVSNFSAGILEDALTFYERFAEENATSPQLEAETIKVHRRVGDVCYRLGQYARAVSAYEACLQLMGAAKEGETTKPRMQRAEVLNQLGLVRYATSDFAAAEINFGLAVKELAGVAASHAESRALLAQVYNNLGQALWIQGRHSAARSTHQKAIFLLEQLVRDHSGNVQFRLALARAYRIFQPFATFFSRPELRIGQRKKGIQILEELVREYPGVPDYQCELCELLTTKSYPLHTGSQQYLADLERAVLVARNLCEHHKTIPRYRAVLARALRERGERLRRSDPATAESLVAESVSLYRTLVQQFDELPVYHMMLAAVLRDNAWMLRADNFTRARALLEEAIHEQETYISLRPQNRFATGALRQMKNDLARSFSVVGGQSPKNRPDVAAGSPGR